MQNAVRVQRRRPLRNVQGARGVAGTARESESADAGTESESGAGRRRKRRSCQTTQARVGGSHRRDDERTTTRTNVIARGDPGMTRMVLQGVIGDTMRIRRGVGIGITVRRGVGVPVDPRTQPTLLLLSGPAHTLLRILMKMNDVDDAGRGALGVLKQTMLHLMLTHTHGTKGAHTATTLPADADTARALLPRKPLAQKHYQKA